MRIVICGDAHGRFKTMYEDALKLNPDVVIQVGDACLFPDPKKADSATKRHGLPVEEYMPFLSGREKIPVRTYFFKGNHEDYDFLGNSDSAREIVPGLIYLPQGAVIELDDVRFGILGGNYASSYFGKTKLNGGRRRHFTSQDIEAIVNKGFDVLLSHEGPKSPEQNRGCEILNEIIARTIPSKVYHGHHHHSYRTIIGETEVIGLSKIGSPGSVVLYE